MPKLQCSGRGDTNLIGLSRLRVRHSTTEQNEGGGRREHPRFTKMTTRDKVSIIFTAASLVTFIKFISLDFYGPAIY